MLLAGATAGVAATTFAATFTAEAATSSPGLPALDTVVRLVYLLAAVCFVLGLHFMRNPATARRGNIVSYLGMGAAVLATVVLISRGADHGIGIKPWAWAALIAGTGVGAVAGAVSARKVQMTAMPQLVSIFNAVGGGAAAVVAVVEFLARDESGMLNGGIALAVSLDVLIGAVTFTGSILAAGKLQGWISGAPIMFPGGRLASILSAVVALGGSVWLIIDPSLWLLVVILLAASCFGVLMVLPIGGADMPVVISLLNAFTGLAVAMAGFVVDNSIMIIAGSLVGAAGTILTQQMAQAMNRSVMSILLGGFGTGGGEVLAGAASGKEAVAVRRTEPDDVAIQLAYAQKVIVVPGYGLAAAQAQRECGELGALLSAHGIEVSYAVHPVAGRMPGHMNVLLAEAEVPYTQLKEMAEVNPEFPDADVALVVGANDVTNPAARKPGNAISGMPILDVDHAKSIVVIKRSLGHGYAGLDNELYGDPKAAMLFADAKKGLAQILAAVKTHLD